jgi:4'-phosphopantetheinyl transferase
MTGASPGSQPVIFHRLETETFQKQFPPVVLSTREAHVWAFSLDASPDVQIQCGRWLSRSEKERADRFRFERDRNHFVVAHGCLRHILSRYYGSTPGALEIVQAVGEKPRLATGETQQSAIMFNLAHSHGHGMVAVAEGFEIGVDLERVRAEVEHLKLAQRFFSHSEWDLIRSEEGERQRALFFRHWVGKEAMLKAKGIGLQHPLDRCELVTADKDDEAIVHWPDETDADQAWLVRFLPLESGWVGAVAAEGTNWTVAYRSFAMSGL